MLTSLSPSEASPSARHAGTPSPECLLAAPPSSLTPVRPSASPHKAYHSAFNDDPSVQLIGNMAILPLHTKIRGPAPIAADPDQPDIVDEALDLCVGPRPGWNELSPS